MSDLDDDFMQMSEDEDFSFEYEDEDEDGEVEEDEIMDDNNNNNNNNGIDLPHDNSPHHRGGGENIDIESLYYTAKATKEDETEGISRAIAQFTHIISLDVPDGVSESQRQRHLEYLFKSIKQLLKLFYHTNQLSQMMTTLPRLFEVLPHLQNKTYAEESINRLVAHYDKPKSDPEFLLRFLDATIDGVIHCFSQPQQQLRHGRVIPQDRLWLKLNLAKSNLLTRMMPSRHLEALQLLSSLQRICESSTESIRGSYMLEILALQMQLYSSSDDNDEDDDSFTILKKLYAASFQVNSAVPHPKIMGVIKECGGEIFMRQCQYHRAATAFYESFKNYDEAGDPKRVSILKRLMIANMLSDSEISPFASKEFQSFVRSPELRNLAQLYDAFINTDITTFNDLIDANTTTAQGHKTIIFNDPFSTKYIEELKSIIQIKTIMSITKYYTKLEFGFLSELLRCPIPRVQQHILKLISSGKLVNAKLDLVDQYLEIVPDRETRIMGNLAVEDIVKKLKEKSQAQIDRDGDQVMGEQSQNTNDSEASPLQAPLQQASQDERPPEQSLLLQQQQQQQQQQQVIQNEIIRDRREYIRLTQDTVDSLNALLGNVSSITNQAPINNNNNTNNSASAESQQQGKTFTIYGMKLHTVLQDWLDIIVTSLPVKTADKLSQIEQVKLEQQQQQQGAVGAEGVMAGYNEVEQETLMGDLALDAGGGAGIGAMADTTGGVGITATGLGTTTSRDEWDRGAVAVGVAADEEAESSTAVAVIGAANSGVISKNDSLKCLIKSVELYQEKLMNHYDDKSSFAKNLFKRFDEE